MRVLCICGCVRHRYRHLLVADGAGPVSFYHLNCEHGTGEAICEFNGAHDVHVYGFKTEGNVRACVRACVRAVWACF